MRLNTITSRVMEFRNHFKNGASLKSLTSKKKIFYTSSFLLISIMFGSCATILSGSKQKVTVTGNVNVPIELLVDGKSYHDVKLPAKVKINRKNETSKIVAL